MMISVHKGAWMLVAVYNFRAFFAHGFLYHTFCLNIYWRHKVLFVFSFEQDIICGLPNLLKVDSLTKNNQIILRLLYNVAIEAQCLRLSAALFF